MQEQWKECKKRRQPSTATPDPKALKAYRSAVLADQRRANISFYPETPRRERAAGDALTALVDNDCALPAAFTSDLAIGLQRWCQDGTWGMCTACQILQSRSLTQKALQQNAGPTVPKSACRRCKAKRPHFVPTPEDVPEPLRNLDPSVLAALRPLDIDVGPEVRAQSGGYSRKVRMTTFSWSLQSVDTKIAALQTKTVRRQARKAFSYLLSLGDDNEYKDYYERHLDPQQTKRPLHFIEEPGLETALWPSLYWKTSMCEFERLNNRRLQQLQGQKKKKHEQDRDASKRDSSSQASDDEEIQLSSSDEQASAGDNEQRQSIKRSFHTKLMSPLLGYSCNFELLQYVYDLHLWTDLGSKKNRAGDTKMRFMMKGHPMSPLYWENIKFGLFDMVRQLRFPDIYWTLAPWEPSYPYHNYMLDEMQKLLCERTRLPAFEAMHLAHTMLEICRSLLAGKGAQGSTGWTQHLLGGKLPGYDVDNCIGFFTRIEYQDGSKKESTQRYHGSGRPHVHALFWLKSKAAAKLEGCMAATLLPAGQEALVALVSGSQKDWSGDSRWPVHSGPSCFDPVNQQLHLHHTQEDASEGVRGYFPVVLDALRCHQDAQIAQGRGLPLSYVTKYVAKWSDSSYNEWMSDLASVTSLCRKVLFEYHPNEPEMVLQLTGAVFRQWDLGTVHRGLYSIRAPRPMTPEQPKFVDHYINATWRRPSMSLFEFLRKSDQKTGAVASWLRKAWKRSNTRRTVEEFANQFTMEGQQVVAAEFLWRLNDHYYGQWCMMHIPFRSMDVFKVKRVEDLVPLRYRWLATAVVLRDDAEVVPPELLNYWRNPARIAQDMQHEARSDGFIQDVLTFVAAQILAIDKYVSGQLDRRMEQPGDEANRAQARGQQDAQNQQLEFRGKQAVLHKLVAGRVELSMQAPRGRARL
eukprot:Skav203736  [mRNA]  locus=scaffold68:197214:199967:+ [translate_table: standard]